MDKEYVRGLRNGKILASKENYLWLFLQTACIIGISIGVLLMLTGSPSIGFTIFALFAIFATFVGAKASGMLNK
jgi:hypothetical protein